MPYKLQYSTEITTIAKIQVWQAGHRLKVARAYYVVNKEFLSRLGLELLWEFQRASLT
jgi:hypothetical protein